MTFWDELKRRTVFRTGVAYLALAWLAVQVADVGFPIFGFSQLGVRVLIVALAIAFPIVLVCTWIYDLTPEGLQRTESIPLDKRVSMHRGRKLDFVVIGVLALALITVVVDQYVIDSYSGARSDSVAVLPLVKLSGEPEQEYFADGMTEALITNLSKISALRVISRTSAMLYKDSDKSLPEIAAELGVTAVIAGSAVLNEDRVRITVQLTDAASDDNVWAETYSQNLEDVLTLQSNVAAEIANAISANGNDRLMAVLQKAAIGFAAGLRTVKMEHRRN